MMCIEQYPDNRTTWQSSWEKEDDARIGRRIVDKPWHSEPLTAWFRWLNRPVDWIECKTTWDGYQHWWQLYTRAFEMFKEVSSQHCHDLYKHARFVMWVHKKMISKDGMHWCMKSLQGRYVGGISCLLQCSLVMDDVNQTATETIPDSKQQLIEKCQQRCNNQFMSLKPASLLETQMAS